MLNKQDPPSTNTERTDALLGKTLELLSYRALHDDDPMTRKHAVYLLGQARDPGSLDTCIQALRDPEKAVRGQAAKALAEIGEAASGQLIPLLNDPDWKVRYRAAEALGIMREKKAVGPLIERLSDEKDHVRYMAAKSLGSLEDTVALKSLEKCRIDQNDYVRKMAEKAIAMINRSLNNQ
jgi:HEAT repeat protein